MRMPIILATSCALFGSLGFHAQNASSLASQPTAGNVTIDVDFAKTTGPYELLYPWFGYDEANYTTAPHGRELLRELHDLSPVPVYIRVHHLLTWATVEVPNSNSVPPTSTVKTRQGRPVYDFKILDGIFDAFKSAGVRPWWNLALCRGISLPMSPAAMTLPGAFPKSTISGKSNNPPKDYTKWRELVRVVTAHLVERYGRDECA